jgi:hypothetical protein
VKKKSKFSLSGLRGSTVASANLLVNWRKISGLLEASTVLGRAKIFSQLHEGKAPKQMASYSASCYCELRFSF